MSKKYCSCGKPNDLTANFCAGCGNKFVSLASATHSSSQDKEEEKKEIKKPLKSLSNRKFTTYNKPNPRDTINIEASDEDDDFDDDECYIPDIDKLEVEIEDVRMKKDNIYNLMSTGSVESSKRALAEKPVQNVDPKEVLKQYNAEARALRNK